ncbi:protochlorophyllide-dependent translocon component 52, chloroplastic-like isoform X2 [Chenopodium quinoa]|uniref:protochlorophyllide-dependent translocon component 52, chloroplastic-like isoform X2 n=1 Tax=Chenopodium quinoa TaxID=63459 RepID=UPI000B76DAD9|nr:protochlorophyllide-dependent translocon component 52, chloroplastic-like isoform X2 [Chenopodium quinoa]
MAAHSTMTMLPTRIQTLNQNLCFTTTTTTTTTTRQLVPPLADSTCLLSFTCNHHHQLSRRNRTNKYSNAPNSTSTPTPMISTNDEVEVEVEEEFDWYAQWYPVMPVSDLDKRKPHAKRVIGLDIVVWWDKTQSQWKVFNDLCPHRLAPLSEGRIDQWGRLQCVYHGWCFDASGQCKLIPQAPTDGPPVHTSKKACVAVYPTTVQNNMVWFWPNSDPQFKDILLKKKPPFLPELDDPSYSNLLANREINYGYEILSENLMDPSHLPYAHYGILKTPTPKVKADREGGSPLNLSVKDMDMNGFTTKQDGGSGKFFAPCIYYVYPDPPTDNANGSVSSAVNNKVSSAVVSAQKRVVLIFICIPVSPGKSRLIWSFPRNFAVWMDQIIPRWVFHLNQNLVLDSDLYLLHVQERKIMEFGPTNWHKTCFVPTKSDALVVGYRRWLKKYSKGQVNWGSKFNGGALPPTPPREELLDRYWTHVVNCSSCNAAYKGLNIAETALQVISFCVIGVVGLTKQGMMTKIQRTAAFTVAILCFVASKWLSHFIYKNFHFHDYDHTLR